MSTCAALPPRYMDTVLELPQELQLPCVVKLSLHRVRDSMSANLEPVFGLLRYVQRVVTLIAVNCKMFLHRTVIAWNIYAT
ncbi:hypothetical protein BC629DRAFT_1540323 [Irpex lacteus]|nr:hypothetical protein BC629DRAFT_1540323 [Irpex lacteus]